MSEIEKLYENARLHKCTNIGNFCKHIGATCERCKKHKYPPFTAEKQIKLIEWLSKRRLLSIAYSEDKNTFQLFNEKCAGTFCEDLATSIATLVQCELDFCTEQEKEQIKDILK